MSSESAFGLPASPQPAAVPAPNLFLNIPLKIAQLPLKPSAKLVYGALKFHARQREVCRVRWGVLARETGLSRPTVARGLRELKQAGLVGSLKTRGASYYVLYDIPLPTALGNPGAAGSPSPAASLAAVPPASPPVPARAEVIHISQNRSQLDTQKRFRETEKLPVGEIVPILAESTRAPAVASLEKLSPKPKITQPDPELSRFLTFLITAIDAGGLGWKLWPGNQERVQGFVGQAGLNQAWAVARECFEIGNYGGAALWDWRLSRAGFTRISSA